MIFKALIFHNCQAFRWDLQVQRVQAKKCCSYLSCEVFISSFQFDNKQGMVDGQFLNKIDLHPPLTKIMKIHDLLI